MVVLGVNVGKYGIHGVSRWGRKDDPAVPNLRYDWTRRFGTYRTVPEVRYDWIWRECLQGNHQNPQTEGLGGFRRLVDSRVKRVYHVHRLQGNFFKEASGFPFQQDSWFESRTRRRDPWMVNSPQLLT